ncbi:nucleolar protein 12-domain-containing protein [Xylariaceae sp. FL1272]|nr:nucleolar protein 12-domain-containing protein [Xylariaceae sp. FL1272]
MFARPRPKKNPLPPPKRRKVQHSIEEIKFDPEARTEYLTGFHKRKVQRIKNAQDQAAKRAREEKLELRKQIREDRKREIEEHVSHVNSMLKEAQAAGYISDDDSENEAEEWSGFNDTTSEAPAKDDIIDHEEEYIDEDRYTTVTVESVSVSRDGLESSRPDEEADDEETNKDGNVKPKEEALQKKSGRQDDGKKKKKFRYETKHERQLTNLKQKAKNKRRRGE